MNKISGNYSSAESLKSFNDYAMYELLCKPFDYSLLNSGIQELYSTPQYMGYELLKAFCKGSYKKELLKECVIEYVYDSNFQAFACYDHDKHYIAISAAIPALLQALFQNILSFTNPFAKHYDQAEDYYDPDYIFPISLSSSRYDEYELREEIDALILDTMPVEKWQRKMSIKLAEIAMVFCVSHEIGHVVRGHPLIYKRRDKNSLNEGDNKKVTCKWVRQAWEIQADKTAIAFLYSYVINTKTNRKRFMHYLKCKNDYELLGKIMYSVYFVFLIMSQRLEYINSETFHPSPLVRATYAMADMAAIVELKTSQKDGVKIITDSTDLAEGAWERLGFNSRSDIKNMDQLGSVLNDLNRAVSLTERYFSKYQWAKFIK